MEIRMDKRKALERYLYYEIALNNLGNMPLFINPTIDELNIPKSMVQTAYRDIKEIKFQGGVIDYLCFISNNYVLIQWEDRVKYVIFNEKKGITYGGETGKSALKLSFLHDMFWTSFGSGSVLLKKEDCRNVIRLFFKSPDYFVKSEVFERFIKEFSRTSKKTTNKDETEISCIVTVSNILLEIRMLYYLLDETDHNPTLVYEVFDKKFYKEHIRRTRE
jgi:hypothetical protein